MIEDAGEVFVVVAEFKNETPLILETGAAYTTYEAARTRADDLAHEARTLRVCVARLEFSNGNRLLLQDVRRLQE